MIRGPDFNGDGRFDAEDVMIYDIVTDDYDRDEAERRAKIEEEKPSYDVPKKDDKITSAQEIDTAIGNVISVIIASVFLGFLLIILYLVISFLVNALW